MNSCHSESNVREFLQNTQAAEAQPQTEVNPRRAAAHKPQLEASVRAFPGSARRKEESSSDPKQKSGVPKRTRPDVSLQN